MDQTSGATPPVGAMDEPSSNNLLLLSLGTLFVAAILYILSVPVRAVLHKLPKRQDKSTKQSKVTQEGTARKAATKVPLEPSKPGVSMKQLMKKQAQNASRPQTSDADKATSHSLYLNTLKGHNDNVNGLAFSAEGSALATACEDKCIRVYRMQDLKAKNISSIKHNMTAVPIDVAFGATADTVAISTRGILQEAHLSMVHLASHKATDQQILWQVHKAHDNRSAISLQSAMQSSASGVLLSSSAKNELRLFSFSGKQLASVEASGLHNHMAAISANGRFFAAATFTSDVKVHEVKYDKQNAFQSVRKVMDLKGHKSQVLCLAFSPDSTKMATASKDGTWRVWNIDVRFHQQEDPKCLLQQPQEVPKGSAYTRLAWSQNNVLAAACGMRLDLLHPTTGHCLDSIENAHDSTITNLEWSPKLFEAGGQRGPVLASSANDTKVRLWQSPLQ